MVLDHIILNRAALLSAFGSRFDADTRPGLDSLVR
jgi:hypothetical protein